jgi:plastocyanin
MVRIGVLLLVLVAALASSSSAADTPLLRGTVGPDFTIDLIDARGVAVTHLDPGTYLVHVDDESEFHNFHLKGPGVDKTTSVVDLESVDWQVNLVNGTYTFLCDVHPVTMKETFTVGNPDAPPPPPVLPILKGTVGPGAKITFARTAKAGTTRITVRDLTAKDNFHLSGPGVNRKTGIPGKGTATWTVNLKAGTYVFRSDAHKKLRGTLKVS